MPTQRSCQGEPSAGQDACTPRQRRASLHRCLSGSVLSGAPQKDGQEAGRADLAGTAQYRAHSTQQMGQAWQGQGIPPTSRYLSPAPKGPSRSLTCVCLGPARGLLLPGAHHRSPELPDSAGAWVRTRGHGDEIPWRLHDNGCPEWLAAGGVTGGDAVSCSHRGRRTAFFCNDVTTQSECA